MDGDKNGGEEGRLWMRARAKWWRGVVDYGCGPGLNGGEESGRLWMWARAKWWRGEW